MPNHVINEVIFEGLWDGDLTALKNKTLNSDGLVDFEVLVPAPLNIWWGSVGSVHEKTFKDTHLDWASRNWGTKWNAYGQSRPEESAGRILLQFKTAWRPPYGWLVAIFNHFKISFAHNWMSEGQDKGYSGKFTFDPNSKMETHGWTETEAGGDLKRHLHKLLWGVEEFAQEDTDQ